MIFFFSESNDDRSLTGIASIWNNTNDDDMALKRSSLVCANITLAANIENPDAIASRSIQFRRL